MNIDETGFRIGVGKNQLIITKRKRTHNFSLPENRESATAVEAILLRTGRSYLTKVGLVGPRVSFKRVPRQST